MKRMKRLLCVMLSVFMIFQGVPADGQTGGLRKVKAENEPTFVFVNRPVSEGESLVEGGEVQYSRDVRYLDHEMYSLDDNSPLLTKIYVAGVDASGTVVKAYTPDDFIVARFDWNTSQNGVWGFRSLGADEYQITTDADEDDGFYITFGEPGNYGLLLQDDRCDSENVTVGDETYVKYTLEESAALRIDTWPMGAIDVMDLEKNTPTWNFIMKKGEKFKIAQTSLNIPEDMTVDWENMEIAPANWEEYLSYDPETHEFTVLKNGSFRLDIHVRTISKTEKIYSKHTRSLYLAWDTSNAPAEGECYFTVSMGNVATSDNDYFGEYFFTRLDYYPYNPPLVIKPYKDDLEYSIFMMAGGYGYGVEDTKYFFEAKNESIKEGVQAVNYLYPRYNDNMEYTPDGTRVDKEFLKDHFPDAVTLTGETELTLTGEAHWGSDVYIRYKDAYDEVCVANLDLWESNESISNKEGREFFPLYSDENEEHSSGQGFCGWLLTRLEYVVHTPDHWAISTNRLVMSFGTSMQEVVDLLSNYVTEHQVEDAYLMIEEDYWIGDKEGYDRAHSEQFVSTGSNSRIKGILFQNCDREYDQYEFWDTKGNNYGTTVISHAVNQKDPTDEIFYVDPYSAYKGDDMRFIEWSGGEITEEKLQAVGENERCAIVLAGKPLENNGEVGRGLYIDDYTLHEARVKNGRPVLEIDGKDYEMMGFYSVPNKFPVMHIDSTTEVFLYGDYADVPEGEANVYLKYGDTVNCYINDHGYTPEEIEREVGKIVSKSGQLEHWALGTIDYSYKVLLNKLEMSNSVSLSNDSKIKDADSSPDVDSLYDQIVGTESANNITLSKADQALINAGCAITIDFAVEDKKAADMDPKFTAQLAAVVKEQPVQYLDMNLAFHVGYAKDAPKTNITQTDKDVEITLSVDDAFGRQLQGGTCVVYRYHGDKVDELTAVYNADKKTVTFKTNKFSEYAITAKAKHTISYELNGGEKNDENPTSYDENTETITLKAPVRTGYTFDGWYSEDTFQNKVTEIAKGSTGDKKFFAKWTANTYAVKFDGNGATGGSMEKLSCTYDQKKELPANAFRKAGHAFTGWNTKADGRGTAYADKAEVNNLTAEAGAEVVLYAQWEKSGYSIFYVLNGGENNAANPDSYDTTKDITLENATRTGYAFAGWYSDVALTKKVTKIKQSSRGAVTLYAKWTANKYTIKFDKNGGTGSMSSLTKRAYGTEYALTGNKFKRTGYAFAGWNTKSDGTGTAYRNKEVVRDLTAESGGTVTLYAQWRQGGFSITYEIKDGVNSPDNPDTYDENTETIILKDPARAGYKFEGWYSSSQFKDKFHVTELAKGSTGNKTFYARWTEYKYTINFDGNGADNADKVTMNSLSGRKYSTKYTLTNNKFKKAGYSFVGWNTEKDGSGTNYKNKASVQKLCATDGGSVTLYAKWQLEEYAIVYNLKGGVNDVSNPDIYNIHSEKITLKDPTRTGYKFEGWYKSSSFKPKNALSEIVSGSTGKKTFYASWSANKYTIVFDGNGADNVDTAGMKPMENRQYGKSYTLTGNKFKKAGCIFKGWNTKPDGSGTHYNNKKSVKNLVAEPGGSVTLYAEWQAK